MICTKWLRGFINLSLMAILFSSLNSAALPVPTEYQVKAAYLFHFSKLITWPKSAFDSSQAPIHICVLGQNPFENFGKFMKGKEIKRRAVKVSYFSNYLHDLTKTNTCHVLFISQSETRNISDILAYTRQYPILTVSDIDDFVIQGGMIQLYNRGNTVRFLFDPQTVDEVSILMDEKIFL